MAVSASRIWTVEVAHSSLGVVPSRRAEASTKVWLSSVPVVKTTSRPRAR